MDEPKDVCGMTRRQINAYFRKNDESHKWPICGRFNATERAIRRVRRYGFGVYGGLEYYLAVEHELIEIVNAA